MPIPHPAGPDRALPYRVDEADRLHGRAALAAADVPTAGGRAPSGPDLDRWEPGHVGDEPVAELGFADLLDVINPLQHIPIVSAVYRSVTGDEISAPARILGGALFGGPVGFVASIANAIVEEASGRDLGETALAALLDDGQPAAAGLAGAVPQEATEESAGLSPDSEPESTARASIAPSAAAGPAPALTGRAALDALMSDLRGGARLDTLDAADPAPAAQYGDDGVEVRSLDPVPAERRTLGATASGEAFAEEMLRALDKYQAMATEGGRVGRPTGDRLNGKL